MKFRFLLTALLSTVAIQHVQAAANNYDLSSAGTIAAVKQDEGRNWSGFYVSFGGAWDKNTYGPTADAEKSKQDYRYGMAMGTSVGYNFVTNKHLLLGVELDSFYNFFKTTTKADSALLTSPALVVVDQFNNSMRIRAGFALDRFMIYATGGASISNITARANVWDAKAVLPPEPAPRLLNKQLLADEGGDKDPVEPIIKEGSVIYGDTQNAWLFGWNVGAGVEYAINDNFRLRVEYRYNDISASGQINLTAKQKQVDNKYTADLEYSDPVKLNMKSHNVNLGIVYLF